MVNEIKVKLGIELNQPIQTELQVIYILSRIRKILEIDKKEKEYKKLKFYCDWALHSQIDNTDAIKDVLGTVIDRPEDASDFFNYRPLDQDLKKFLTDYNLPSTIYNTNETERIFKEILTRIYSDTPLIVKQVKKTKITINEVIIHGAHGIDFSVTHEE